MPRRYYDNHDRAPDHSVRNRIVAGALVAAITFGGGYEINRAIGIIDDGLLKLSQFVNPDKNNDAPAATPEITVKSTPNPVSTPNVPPSLPKTPDPEQADRVAVIGESIVATFDNKDIPKTIKIAGQEFNIHQKAINAMEESSVRNGEVEIVAIIPTANVEKSAVFKQNGDQDFKPSPDRPLITKRPETVNPDDLAKRGIVISQSKDVQLGIRPEAFTTGPLKFYTPNSDFGLHFVLVNGPIVATSFLSPEQQKYAPLLPPPPAQADINAFRIKMLEDYGSAIDEIRINIAKSINEEDQKIFRDNLLTLKYELKTFQGISDLEISKMISNAVGTYYYNTGDLLTEADRKGKKIVSVIFVAVGEQPQRTNSCVIVTVENGGFHFGRYSYEQIGDNSTIPALKQTHLRPSDFKTAKGADLNDPDSYIYDAQSPGEALEHEVAHDKLIIQAFANGQEWNDSERDTDLATIKAADEAFKKWQDSGYKDDSGYGFVLIFDNGKKFILTRNENITEKHQSQPVTFNLGKDEQTRRPWKQKVVRARI